MVSKNKAFDQVYEELQKAYRRARNSGFEDEEGQSVVTAHLGTPFTTRILHLVNTTPASDVPTVQAVDFASLDMIEKVLARKYPVSDVKNGEVVVEDFWLGTQTITKAVQCHGRAFRDQSVLTARWNNSYYDKVSREKFFEGREKRHDSGPRGLGYAADCIKRSRLARRGLCYCDYGTRC